MVPAPTPTSRKASASAMMKRLAAQFRVCLTQPEQARVRGVGQFTARLTHLARCARTHSGVGEEAGSWVENDSSPNKRDAEEKEKGLKETGTVKRQVARNGRHRWGP